MWFFTLETESVDAEKNLYKQTLIHDPHPFLKTVSTYSGLTLSLRFLLLSYEAPVLGKNINIK